jgi:flagellin-specific chaperone FliS
MEDEIMDNYGEILRERMEIYDEITKILTDYENEDNAVDISDLYSLLCKIQNKWEDVITSGIY